MIEILKIDFIYCYRYTLSFPFPGYCESKFCLHVPVSVLVPGLLWTSLKRPLGRPRRRWEGNIKMDLREVRCHPGEWIALAEDRGQWRVYVRAVMNLRVP